MSLYSLRCGYSIEQRTRLTSTSVDTLVGAVKAVSLDGDSVKPIREAMLNVEPKNVDRSKLKDLMSGTKKVLEASADFDKETAGSMLDLIGGLADEAGSSDKEMLQVLSSFYRGNQTNKRLGF